MIHQRHGRRQWGRGEEKVGLSSTQIAAGMNGTVWYGELTGIKNALPGEEDVLLLMDYQAVIAALERQGSWAR